MDSKLFRLTTSPNYYAPVQAARPTDIRRFADQQNVPASDSRYPGYAAPMADARLVTDYQPHCKNNIPAGKQYPTTRWMQRNGEKIIDMYRTTSAKLMGAEYGLDSTVVPPASQTVHCTRSVCSREDSGAPGGIGTERREPVPELFGTYMIPQSEPVPPNIRGTSAYEGGRNSLRGALVQV